MNSQRSRKVVGVWLLVLFMLVSSGFIIHTIRDTVLSKVNYFNDYAVVFFNTKTNQTSILYKNTNQFTLWSIPNDTSIVLARGFGAYRVDKIYALDQLSENSGQLLMSSIANYYKIPVLGSVIFEDEKIVFYKPVKQQIVQAVLQGKWLGYNGSLQKPSLAFIALLLPVKGDILKLVTAFPWIGKTTDDALLKEDLSLEIINTTTVNGLAEKFSQYLEANKMRVIRTDNRLGLDVFVCRIHMRKNYINSYTRAWLMYFCGCEEGNQISDGSRSDISIEVGLGYQEFLEGK